MATPERVVIAAAGVVTPIGQDLEAFWSSLVTGASGISQIERVPVADLRVQRGDEDDPGRVAGGNPDATTMTWLWPLRSISGPQSPQSDAAGAAPIARAKRHTRAFA